MSESRSAPIPEPALEDGVNFFWASGCPYARRTQIALIEKKIPFKSHLLSFDRGDLRTDWFKKYNPRSQVPTIVDDGVIVYESIGTLEYLEHFYSEHPLLPQDKKWRAIVLTRIHEVDGNLKTVTTAFYNKTVYSKQAYPVEELDEAREAIFKELDRWEIYLQNGKEKYFGGKDFSLADVALFPILSQLIDRYGLPLKGNPRYPLLSQWYETVSFRDGARESVPPHWKDSKVASLFA